MRTCNDTYFEAATKFLRLFSLDNTQPQTVRLLYPTVVSILRGLERLGFVKRNETQRKSLRLSTHDPISKDVFGRPEMGLRAIFQCCGNFASKVPAKKGVGIAKKQIDRLTTSLRYLGTSCWEDIFETVTRHTQITARITTTNTNQVQSITQ